MMELFIPPREGTPIHSVREDFLFLHGSVHDASTARIVLVGVISLALPTNLLVMDGIKPGGEEILFLVLRDSLFSSSLVLRKTVFLD